MPRWTDKNGLDYFKIQAKTIHTSFSLSMSLCLTLIMLKLQRQILQKDKELNL